MLPDEALEKLDPVLRRDWHVVTAASNLPDDNPLGVKLLGHDIVIWRSDDGLRAARNLCRHRGGAFTDLMGNGRDRFEGARVIDGQLRCPYHGWTYNSDGQCVLFPYDREQKPPTTAQLFGGYGIREQYGWIWVCLEPGYTEIPLFPEWDNADYGKVPSGPYRINATAPRFIENFLDVAHFPFVHEGYLGVQEHPEVPDYRVFTTDEGIFAENIQFYQPNPDGSGKGGWETYNYRVFRPLTAYFSKQHNGRMFTLFCHATPHDETESSVWMNMAMNYPFDAGETVTFQDKISGQDIAIVESQRPELLPLDLTVELSMRADRASIAYRRWLAALGVTYGTE